MSRAGRHSPAAFQQRLAKHEIAAALGGDLRRLEVDDAAAQQRSDRGRQPRDRLPLGQRADQGNRNDAGAKCRGPAAVCTRASQHGQSTRRAHEQHPAVDKQEAR